MNGLLWCVCGFLMIWGAAAFWEWLLLRLNRPKILPLGYELIPLGGKVEDMEQLLRYFSLTCGEKLLIFVDLGLDDESWELCRRFCWQEKALLMKPREVWEMIFAENDLEEEAKS